MWGVRTTVRIVLACVSALGCASCGPRMISQPSVMPYEQRVPPMPAGSVPTRGRLVTLTLQQSKVAKNPVPNTPDNIENGRIYYGYYCVMCHGTNGDGNGPVGISYVPKPTDLSSGRVKGMRDGRLYWAMLHGMGHDPVMVQTVPLEHRWPLVLYVRGF